MMCSVIGAHGPAVVLGGFLENFDRIRQPCQINKSDNGKDETAGQTKKLEYQ